MPHPDKSSHLKNVLPLDTYPNQAFIELKKKKNSPSRVQQVYSQRSTNHMDNSILNLKNVYTMPSERQKKNEKLLFFFHQEQPCYYRKERIGANYTQNMQTFFCRR